MLAFYGWTDRLIVNLLNTKISYYPDEEADLFILALPRVSAHLVHAVEKSGAFRHVFWLERPAFHKEKGPLTLMEKAAKLLSGERYYRCYRRQLDRFCGETCYRKLFTGAFWSETLFLFRYFRRRNAGLTISMVEEGTTNYNSPKGWQFRCMPTLRARERLMRVFYFPLTWGRARKNVRQVYLYSLEMRRSDADIPAVRLPRISADTPVCLQVLRESVGSMDLNPYKERLVYWIAGPIIPGYEDSFEETYGIIDEVLKILPSQSLLIKVHPKRSGYEAFDERYRRLAYVDKRDFLLEGALAEISLDQKLLITRSSSVPLSVALQSASLPYVIFTYRLYTYYRKHCERVSDEMVDDLRVCCPALRVEVPDTIEKLHKLLSRWVCTGSL